MTMEKRRYVRPETSIVRSKTTKDLMWIDVSMDKAPLITSSDGPNITDAKQWDGFFDGFFDEAANDSTWNAYSKDW